MLTNARTSTALNRTVAPPEEPGPPRTSMNRAWHETTRTSRERDPNAAWTTWDLVRRSRERLPALYGRVNPGSRFARCCRQGTAAGSERPRLPSVAVRETRRCHTPLPGAGRIPSTLSVRNQWYVAPLPASGYLTAPPRIKNTPLVTLIPGNSPTTWQVLPANSGFPYIAAIPGEGFP